jgi:hypothetical protein
MDTDGCDEDDGSSLSCLLVVIIIVKFSDILVRFVYSGQLVEHEMCKSGLMWTVEVELNSEHTDERMTDK